MFAKQMRKDVISGLMLLFFVLSLLSGPLFSQEKKLKPKFTSNQIPIALLSPQ
jgi:hypothetical protein